MNAYDKTLVDNDSWIPESVDRAVHQFLILFMAPAHVDSQQFADALTSPQPHDDSIDETIKYVVDYYFFRT